MSDKTLAQVLTANEITAPADIDFVLYAIDSPTGTPIDAGIRPENILKMMQYLSTVATVDVANDKLLVFDNSAGSATIKAVSGLGMLQADGSVELTADWDAGAYEIRAETFESDVATGTAPLTIASTTVVTNLNADKVDGTDVNDSGTSTSDLWTANKIQSTIDAAVDGRSWKDDVRCRATANIDLAGGGLAAGQTVDGVTLATGERVACFEQSTGSEDGIYVVPATGAASRSDDFASGVACAGFAFRVTEGTTHDNTTWYVSNDKGADTVGTHAITLAGGGAGETNTASSIGGGDAAIFKQKTGVDFEIRSISGTNSVAVSLNGDVVEVSGAAFGLLTGNLSQFAATTSAQLAGTISDETGSGALVFATSPTLVTPALGTPASGSLGSCTDYEGTAVASTGEAGGTKFLREDGDGTCSWQSVPGGGDALVANPLSQFAATTSAQLAGVLSDETGSGAAVFATSPTLVTPVLGTPSSGTLSSCTGYEGTAVASTGEAGGTKFLREDGDGTCSWQSVPGGGDALVANPLSQFAATTSAQLAGVISDETGSGLLVFATSPTLTTPDIGTPSAGVLTNCTGTAAGLTAGTVTTNANLTGHVTSTGNATVLGSFTLAQLNAAVSDATLVDAALVASAIDTSAEMAAILTDETGTGSIVFSDSPTLVTPALGTPSALVLTNATGLPVSGLATGTDGELITWDAAGNPATVAVGTSGHVLTSNGVGAAPTFQAAGAADNLGDHTLDEDLILDDYGLEANGDRVFGSEVYGAWDVAAGSYASKSLSVSTEEGTPKAIALSADGTKAYVVGIVNDSVEQYTLSTAWDISTGSYASKSADVSTEEGSVEGLEFSVDGLTMYVVGTVNDTIYQYTLSTAWDVSTASYASKSLSVTTQDTAPISLAMSPDGTRAYILGSTNKTVYQYTLTTAGDISTGSYASKSFSVNSQETAPQGLAFSPDGRTMYVVGTANDAVYQYRLRVPWDVSTAKYVSKSLDVSTEEATSADLAMSRDGTKLYLIGTTNDTIYQYTLTSSTENTVASSVSHTFKGGTSHPWVTLQDGGTVTLDGRDGDRQVVTIGGNRTIALQAGTFGDGQSILLRVTQDGTGSRTLTWPAGVKWSAATAPTLTTTGDRTDLLGLVCIDNTSGSEKFLGVFVDDDFTE